MNNISSTFVFVLFITIYYLTLSLILGFNLKKRLKISNESIKYAAIINKIEDPKNNYKMEKLYDRTPIINVIMNKFQEDIGIIIILHLFDYSHLTDNVVLITDV